MLCSVAGTAAAIPVPTAEALARYQIPRAHAVAARLTDEECAALPRLLHFLNGLGVQDLASAVRREPQLLRFKLHQQVAPRVEYLLDLGVINVGSVVEHAPSLLGCDIGRDLIPKLAVLQSLGVKRIAEWLGRNPRFVNLDVELDMRPAVELLRSLGDHDDPVRLGSIVQKLNLLAFRPDVLKPRIDYLRRIGVHKLGRAVSVHPQLLVYSVEKNMEPKVSWLRAQGVQNVARLIARNPKVMSMPLTSLAPKLEFVLGKMERSLEEVEAFPRVLNYSLSHLQMRHQFLSTHNPGKKVGLHRLLRAAPHTFATKFAGRTLEEYESALPALGSDDEPRPRAATAFIKRQADALLDDELRRETVEELRERVAELLEDDHDNNSTD